VQGTQVKAEGWYGQGLDMPLVPMNTPMPYKAGLRKRLAPEPVSYTHLTLPTSDLV